MLEMRKPVGPLDRYVEVRRSRAETEEDFEHVVQSCYKVEESDENSDEIDGV